MSGGIKNERAAQVPDSDNVAMLHKLLKLTNRLMAPFSTHLAHRHRISLNEFRMLMTIGTMGRAASHQLAEMTGVNVMSVSRAVATLERHGRIAVSRDPDNRRRKWLILTPEGERLYTLMRPQSEKVAAYLFNALSAEQAQQMEAIVNTLIDTLEARDDNGESLFLNQTRPEDEEV